jgi:anti-sigma regulatory factor (Ser/Thr protein kinase)
MGASLEIVPSSVAKGSADRIITNELVTKSLTYAFLEDRAGTVTVKLSRDGEIHLVVEDDGVGCADGEDRSGQVDTRALRQRSHLQITMVSRCGRTVC